MYLAKALAALTPEGRARVDELLDELVESAGGDERVVRFARARRAEVDSGRAASDAPDDLTDIELGALKRGFKSIRDEEHLDDVADWANAVVSLLQNEPQDAP